MPTLDADSVIRRTQKHLETQLDDEIIMMHLESGIIYTMVDTANEIWEQLREPVSFGKLIDHVIERFKVDRETCVREVGEFILELKKLDIVEIEAGAR